MMGDKAGIEARLSKSVHEVNQKQRDRFFEKIQGHFKASGGLTGKVLAFWGLAFKPRTDDIREAPALTLMRKAMGYGAIVRGFDPVAMDNVKEEMGPGVTLLDDMYECAKGADALVVSTDWDEFKSPDFARLASQMKAKVIFDGRNLYRRQQMSEAGYAYYSVGLAPVKQG